MYKNSLGSPEAAGGTWKSGGRPCPSLQKTSQNATFSLSRRRGRCLHRPAGIARFMAVFRRIRVGFPFRAVGVDAYIDPPSKTETPPRGGGWTLLYWVSFSPLQNASQNAIFSVSRRRGRCLHRPAGIARFMAVFRRIRVGFLFCTVGADDPVRPPELPGFMEIQCEIATS